MFQDRNIFKHERICVYKRRGDFMKRFTVSIPEDLKKKIDAMPHINWPEVAKQAVLKKLEQMQKFQSMVNHGRI